MNKNIYFYYPSHVIGGAELLFSRIANYLASLNYNVGYIGFKDDIVLSLLNLKVNFIITSDIIALPDDSVIITHPARCFEIPKIITNKTNYLFWVLHIDELKHINQFYKLNNAYTKKVITKMIKHKALVDIDKQTTQTIEYFSKTKMTYESKIPVMLNNCCFKIRKKLLFQNAINLAWIGRLSRDKIYSLINILYNLENISLKNTEIYFHIIGDGECNHKLKKTYNNFHIIQHKTIAPNQLSSFLIQHIDLVFAYGTSLLEAEKLGIPTIAPYYTTNKTFSNEFVWGFNLKDYCLAPINKEWYSNDTNTIENLLNNFMENIQFHSTQAREHFENFTLDKQINLFLQSVNRTTFSNNTYLKLYKLRKIYILKNLNFKNKIRLKIYYYIYKILKKKGLIFYD
ncbi:hypothetical protein ACUVGL_000959 [Campylobacter lari]